MEASLKQFIEEMTRHIASHLGSLYDRKAPSPGTPHLIFPKTRQEEVRVSEQESKILICRYLDNTPLLHSVETPTLETYVQKGKTGQSARTDVTLYDGPNGEPRRLLNIELKAHNCTVESIRKDLEKLIREDTDGVWFHTLERADRGTFASLLPKFEAAFQTLRTHYASSKHDYVFAFCTLSPNYLLSRTLTFSGNPDQDAIEIESAFGGRKADVLAGWNVLNLSTGEENPVSIFRPDPVERPLRHRKACGGSRQGSMIYAPEINPESFIHLSTRGSSYYLRDYSRTGPKSRPTKFKLQGCPNLEQFRRTAHLIKEIDATAEDRKYNLDTRPDYWHQRIQSLNRESVLPVDRRLSTAVSKAV